MGLSYDNLGGMNMQNGTGDIILAPSASSGKVKKKWIIAVVLVVSLAAVGLIAWLLINNVFFAATPDSVRQDFNKFANYVMSGEELTSEINPELDLSYDYYFSDRNLTIDQKKTVYSKTKKLFNNFVKQYNKLNDDEKKTIISDIDKFDSWKNSTSQLIDFIDAVYIKNAIDTDFLINIYFSGGVEAVENIPTTYYDLAQLEDNVYVRGFLEDLGYYVEAELATLDYLESINCLKETSEASDFCVSQLTNGAILSGYREKKADSTRAYSYLRYDYGLSDSFVLGVFVLNALINNGDIAEYVTV